MLQHVIFAGRPGLQQVINGQFVITLATSGMRIDEYNWHAFIKGTSISNKPWWYLGRTLGRMLTLKNAHFLGVLVRSQKVTMRGHGKLSVTSPS